MHDGALTASIRTSGLEVSIDVNAVGPIAREKLEVSSKFQEAASAMGDAALVDLEQGKEVTVASAGGLSMNLGN